MAIMCGFLITVLFFFLLKYFNFYYYFMHVFCGE